nr:retrovirus-related Pol polyprotein from transposon TNT 1-94 [Tanacetum cinerariifolium]
MLRSDRGGEYISQEFLDHLKDHGIIAHRTPPYTPQHNGVSKRRNRTLLDMVRSMMSQTTLPKSFWDYALETAARILNMVPTKKVEKTPYENSLITQEASGSLEDLEIIQEEETHHSIDTSLNYKEDDIEIDEPQSDIVPIRRSTRTRNSPDRTCLYIDAEEHELGDLGEPANYKAALLDPESEKWLNAMNVEMQSMKDNEVWVLVEFPPNGKTVGSKWLFKKKTDMDEVVYTYKARLDSHAIAAYYDYEIWQMDVKSAFLNGYLNEDVYMEQPEGEATYILGIKNPGDLHWTTVKNITKTGYVFILNGGAIDWKSAKQSIFATSYAEAEYIAAFDASKEAIWVRKFISGLGVVPTIEESISMYCDNTGAIAIANESGITKGARHFRAKVHYLREVIEYGDVKLEKVHTYDNLADPFTKALAFPKHSEHTRNIGMLIFNPLMIYHSKYVHCRLTVWEYCYIRQMRVLVILFEYMDGSHQTHMLLTRDAYWIPQTSIFTLWVRCHK